MYLCNETKKLKIRVDQSFAYILSIIMIISSSICAIYFFLFLRLFRVPSAVLFFSIAIVNRRVRLHAVPSVHCRRRSCRAAGTTYYYCDSRNNASAERAKGLKGGCIGISCRRYHLPLPPWKRTILFSPILTVPRDLEKT